MRLLAFAAVLLLAVPGWAQYREPDVSREYGTLGGTDRTGLDRTQIDVANQLAGSLDTPGSCGAPVTTCDPVALGGAGDLDCPEGHFCRCVPSCPACRDCDGGVCLPDPRRPVPADPPVCGEQRRDLDEALERLLARTAHCREHSDCVFVDVSTRCEGRCAAVVNRRLDERVSRQVRRLDRRICSGFEREGCSVTVPDCVPSLPACREGRCVRMPLPVFEPPAFDPPPRDGGVVIDIRPVLP